MTEKNGTTRDADESGVQPPSSLLETYIDEQIQNAIKQHYETEHKRKKFRNAWRSASPITKGSFYMTAGIAVATIVYAVVAVFQLDAMHSTLGVMKTSSDESSRQMWSAIDNMNWMARSMDWSQKTTKRGIEASTQQSQMSLQASIDQFNLAQRPWIGISASITKFDWGHLPTGDLTLDIDYKIAVENFGTLPASQVYLFYDDNPIPVLPKRDPIKVAREDLEKFCRTKIEGSKGDAAATVFPRQKYDQFPEWRSSMSASGKSAAEWQKNGIEQYLHGCVTYYSPTDKQMHQSGFFFQPMRKTTNFQLPKFGDSIKDIYMKDFSGAATSN